ncbi:glutamine--fructose-6-phosphate transaminase (isomerizing), partial [bacterium]|nr:glutamine--fructose-6-phosphate transaminase (isomerizing) [bacterium]
MCGIIGYVGFRDAVPVLLNGLKRMEYRGYDSSGIALIDNGNLHIHKQIGRIEALEQALKSNGSTPTAHIGIGHTRWATHGAPTERNAHPHASSAGDIVLIHNGIIENYSELKQALTLKGHTFKSDTDTEVLAHLIEEEYLGDLQEAVIRALRRVEGTYGIAVMHRSEPDKLVVGRLGSPLVIGMGDNEHFVASDLAAMVEHTRDVVFLEDGEVGTVTKDDFKHVDLDSSPVARSSMHIDFSLEEIEKGGYKHFMLKEIMEQPRTLEDTMRGRVLEDEGEVRLGGLAAHMDTLKNAERVLLLACGTSYHSGLVGEYMIEEWARIPVEVEYASEFRYRNPIIPPNTVAFAISQSGETADTLAALREAQKRGALGLGIVNTVGSTIARESDAGVYLHAGPEIGVASTKAFTSQVTVLALIGILLGRQRGMTKERAQGLLRELRRLPGLVQTILDDWSTIEDIAKTFSRSSNFLYLGRGPNYPVALEGALKLKEISYIHAEGYPAAEMKHGPIALIDRMMPVVIVAPNDHTYNKVISNIEEVRSRGGVVIAVVNEEDDRMEQLSDYVIRVPTSHPELMPLLATIPLQLLAYRIADLLGWDVDKPRNLAKSVTVE